MKQLYPQKFIKNWKPYDDDSDDYHRGYEDGVEACQDAINCM